MILRSKTLLAVTAALSFIAPKTLAQLPNNAAPNNDADAIHSPCGQSLSFIPQDSHGCPRDRFTLIVEFKNHLFTVEQAHQQPFDVVGFLQKHTSYDVFITGLAETAEGPAFDQRLSEKRAREARLFLIEQGIHEPRITPHARMTEPMATQEAPLGEEQNRRLKLDFVKMYRDF